MFKNQSKKYKGKHVLLKEKFKSESSTFKSGFIEMSKKEILKEKLNNVQELKGLPKKGVQIRIVTKKAINTFDFILAVLATEEIEEMIIAFYRIGKKVIQELNQFVNENKIKSIYFLINDGWPKLTPDAYNLIKQLENNNWKIRLDNNHTKIILLKTSKNNFIIEGSGNLSVNARIEQYVIDNDIKLFEFHKKWITDEK